MLKSGQTHVCGSALICCVLFLVVSQLTTRAFYWYPNPNQHLNILHLSTYWISDTIFVYHNHIGKEKEDLLDPLFLFGESDRQLSLWLAFNQSLPFDISHKVIPL